MNALETLVLLFIFRLVLPFGALLLLGEWMHSRESRRFGM
jgi:flagellar biosynthesis protein FliQ